MYIVCFLMGISFCCAVFVGAEKVKASIERRRMAQVEREGRLQSIERVLGDALRQLTNMNAIACNAEVSARKADERVSVLVDSVAHRNELKKVSARVDALEALNPAPVVPNA